MTYGFSKHSRNDRIPVFITLEQTEFKKKQVSVMQSHLDQRETMNRLLNKGGFK